jgi:hypothetical protein
LRVPFITFPIAPIPAWFGKLRQAYSVRAMRVSVMRRSEARTRVLVAKGL